jgi:hypothetical protein
MTIDYSEIVILVVVLFGIVGMMRGFFKEGVTALFVAFLAVLVRSPENGRAIIEWINEMIAFFLRFLRSGFSFDPNALAAQTVNTQALDPYSYQLWIVIMVVLVAVSYAIGEATFSDKVTPLSRLLGGLLGAFNGYVLANLVRQYLVVNAANQAGISATALSAGSQAGSIQVANVPTTTVAGGAGLILIGFIVIAVVGLLIAGDRLKLPIK